MLPKTVFHALSGAKPRYHTWFFSCLECETGGMGSGTRFWDKALNLDRTNQHLGDVFGFFHESVEAWNNETKERARFNRR